MNPKVLITHSEAGVRGKLEYLLEAEGFRVLVARDAGEALQMIASHPDLGLMLSQVEMNPLTGPELAQEAAKFWPDLPVLYFDFEPRQVPGELLVLPMPFAEFTSKLRQRARSVIAKAA